MSRFATPRPFRTALLALAAAAWLAACGGGGGGGGDGAGSGAAAAGSATTFSIDPTLSGVAAVGAPLNGAQIQVIDAKGTAVGSATTHAADGSYRLTLSSKTLNAPLLLQARGIDAAGNPQVLHSAVPALSAASAAMVANVTPLSDAIVALGLGADPQPVFAAAGQNAGALANLATAAGAAAEFLKTLIKTPVSDLKISDAKKLDLLSDAGFAANKGTQDLLLESLRVGLGKSSKGVAQLQLSNKLLVGAAAEVVVELPGAQTELLKTSGAAPATAISSTLKATTSPTATLANLGTLDELGAALNKLIAQGQDAGTIAASPLLASYDVHNGRSKADVVAKLADYASKNRQFGRWLITGCADEVISGGLCNRVLVSAPISDSSGSVVEIYSDALSYNKSATSGSKWNLIGNGKKLGVAIYPVAYLSLGTDGALAGGVTPNPGVGIQAEIQALSLGAAPSLLIDSATLQTPGGYSIPFAYCELQLLCISGTPGATRVRPGGGIADTAMQQSAVGWIGGADSVRGAKYIASYTQAGSASSSRNVYLRAEVLAELPRSRFPQLDGVSGNATLRSGQLLVGLTLNWAGWAAANPDLRLISVRTVLADGSTMPMITDTTPPLPPRTSLELAGLWPDATPSSYELWLGAQDAAGRRYYTRYTLAP